jgi:hypothetical protein
MEKAYHPGRSIIENYGDRKSDPEIFFGGGSIRPEATSSPRPVSASQRKDRNLKNLVTTGINTP